MSETVQDQALRERWRGFFGQVLPPQPEVIDSATTAAMQAIARGGASDDAVAAGMAAARAVIDSTSSAASTQVPHQSSRRAARSSASRPAGPAAGQAGSGAPPGPEKIWPENSAVVYSVERRSESLDGVFFQVLSCRLLRLENGCKPVPPHIPVELRGRSIVGPISKGDVVVIPYGPASRTRVVKTLENLTTQSVVEAKGRPFRKTRTVARTSRLLFRLIAVVITLLMLAALGVGAYLLINGSHISLR
jgi:hypothetical protein